MSDGPRALLTDGEREVLAGERDVSDSYYYQVRSSVRKKIEQLTADHQHLEEHEPDLAAELESVVCGVDSERLESIHRDVAAIRELLEGQNRTEE